MDGYNHHLNESSSSRGNFLYSPSRGVTYGRSSSGGSSSIGNHHQQSQIPTNTFHLQSGRTEHCFPLDQAHPTVKIEASSLHPDQIFPYPFMMRGAPHQTVHPPHLGGSESTGDVETMKAKIIAHPQYFNLLEAFMDCQKVGATPEVASRLSAAQQEHEARQRQPASAISRENSKDPELDQFMEAYYDMLVKYREELARPVHEAMDFVKRVESQLNALSNGLGGIFTTDEKCEVASEEDEEKSGEEREAQEIDDPRVGDRELKSQLLRKYSGYLGSLKQELSKKKKKGKLPKDARQKLLTWWDLHYKWPYPSESEKVALAELTGLDQKQINNWFINQRKRHWKPSEDMQFMVMDDGSHSHPQNATLYMNAHYLPDGHYRLGPS